MINDVSIIVKLPLKEIEDREENQSKTEILDYNRVIDEK